jgi:hypothetical protein
MHSYALAQKEASRGWFEDDDVFKARLAASRSNFAEKQKSTSKKTPSSGSGYKATPVSAKWVTPGTQPKKSAWGKPATKKKPAGGGSVFAAMMADSDSD